MTIISVLVDAPAYSNLSETLDYSCPVPLTMGQLVRVPLRQRQVLGIVWKGTPADHLKADAIRPAQLLSENLPALGESWCRLVTFAARYYQRSIGEVALQALPPHLHTLQTKQVETRLQKTLKVQAGQTDAVVTPAPHPTPEQTLVLAALAAPTASTHTHLLFGSTGSGKTEVYLHRIQVLLSENDAAQALVLVPEINLTPQIEARLKNRFEPLYGVGSVVSMHSGMTPSARLNAWLAAHLGRARVVLGTRLAVFASMPGLRLIVVDEEQDASYKQQQDGARYSARDLAVYRGHLEGIQVILGSATPSLESWYQSRPAQGSDRGGRYVRLSMPSRVGTSVLPEIRCVDMRAMPKGTQFAPLLLDAMRQRIGQNQQVLVLINRRGWAPVLMCSQCDWKSQCPQCSAFRVFHRTDRSLRCHHCGLAHRVPRQCPGCGHLDLGWQGGGTEQLEDCLTQQFSQSFHPSGRPYEILRIDTDSTRHKGSLEHGLNQVHAGAVDVLIGTQMIAKGHDFKRVGMVVVADSDGALFSGDFRATEHLFALLLQAAGRAGRAGTETDELPAQVWVQTRQPEHPLFAALRQHDYMGFAEQQLKERQMAAMPPFSHQALLRAESRQLSHALAFLEAARTQGLAQVAQNVSLYQAVPMAMQKVANVERAQMLLESSRRSDLQHFLQAWLKNLRELHKQHPQVMRWAVDVDPLSV